MKKLIIISVTTLVILALAGCGGGKPQTARLELEANHTTGYEWRAEQDPELFDITSEYEEKKTEEPMTGVGGTEIFTLKPKKEGTTEINFYYERPWEEDSAAARLTYKVAVDSKMHIEVLSAGGEIPGEESEAPELPEMIIE